MLVQVRHALYSSLNEAVEMVIYSYAEHFLEGIWPSPRVTPSPVGAGPSLLFVFGGLLFLVL